MEKIKIVRHEIFCEDRCLTRYDIYCGFTGIPSTWPFMTKWILDKAGLTQEEMLRYMRCYLIVTGKVKIIVKSKYHIKHDRNK